MRDVVFMDTPNLEAVGLPDIEMSCDHGLDPNAEITRRWLRVY